jgi:hypothetical protein
MEVFQMSLSTYSIDSTKIVKYTKVDFGKPTFIHDIVMLKKKCDEEYNFIIAQERELIDKYADKDEKGQAKTTPEGLVIFKNVQDRDTFESEVSKLKDTDIPDLKAITIKASDFKSTDEMPTPDEMIQLEGVVDFVD